MSEKELRLAVDWHRYINLGRLPSYNLLKRRDLGEGSFGVAYLVDQTEEYCEETAIKSSWLGNEKWTVAAFNRSESLAWTVVNEVMALKRCLVHDIPQVVQLKGAAVADGHFLIALGFAMNGTLERLAGFCKEIV